VHPTPLVPTAVDPRQVDRSSPLTESV
ncbi:uncharacterized protein METZ01_LOCUS48074, partial [marine metagenome]